MTPASRIASLVEQLEDVDVRQWMQPGEVILMESPICEALAAEGVAAIDPLRAAVSSDTRLTRSFGYVRDFMPPRKLISVAEVAEFLLSQSYGFDVSEQIPNPEDRRVWLDKFKFASVADRAFDRLTAEPTGNEKPADLEVRWLHMAELLLADEPNSQSVLAEQLRDRRNPSLTDVLTKRALAMRTHMSLDMSLLLYKWDPQASLPVLREMAKRPQFDGVRNSRLMLARVQLGDWDAAREWAAGISGEAVVPVEQLSPLWTIPENEFVREVWQKLFFRLGAPMAITPSDVWGPTLRSPLLLQPAFREMVIAALGRTEIVGTVSYAPATGRVVRLRNSVMGTGVPKDAAPVVPMSRDLRMGEYIADQLSKIPGFPKIDLLASLEDIDSQVRHVAQLLRTQGANLTISQEPSVLLVPEVTLPKQ